MHASIATTAVILLGYLHASSAQSNIAAAEASRAVSRLVAEIRSYSATMITTTSASTSVVAYNPQCTGYSDGCYAPNNIDPNAPPYCSSAQDCESYCGAALPDTPYGGWTICEGSLEATCTCIALTESTEHAIVDGIIAIGETACVVWDAGLTLTGDLLKAIGLIPGTPPALKWAGKIFRLGESLMAQGSKIGECDNSMCPGRQFVAIDPENVLEQLGMLDPCY